MAEKFGGFATTHDGKHVTLSQDEARALLDSAEKQKQQRASDIPTSHNALAIISNAMIRLRELGWRDACYCPKDGSEFAVLELGSTGIFRSFYMGESPDGRLYLDDFFVHPDGCLFKPLDRLTDDERTQLEQCDEQTRRNIERDCERFASFKDQQDEG
ncbi:MAG: hypothetical protein AAF739_00470 [Pseudomonadota bacterium]